MAFPSFEQYNEAFQIHAVLLTDPELKAGKVARNGLGLPLAISGGFALTYTISSGPKKFAVRCFHRESKALQQRYIAISKRLEALHSPYFVDFNFQPQGIKVGGVAFPIVKMAWADGSTLGEFLEDNRSNGAALSKLSVAIASLAEFLEREALSHGDIQPGNLMVSGGGAAVQLIDYDGMYVDGIQGLGSAELGHVNFQHPQRQIANPFGPGLDRFSLIALSVALKALRLEPALWAKTKSEMDAILFRANDFTDPGGSAAFAALASNSSLSTEIKNFAAVCASALEKTPSLADFVAGRLIPSASVQLKGVAKAGVGRASYIAAHTVLDATEYRACLRNVGNRVEVIGEITNVKEALDKNGKPFVFINFSDWRGNAFKVSIWASGLAKLTERPDRSWVGKWLSVVGLMEPPFGPSAHITIAVSSTGQMTLLPPAEAQWRLGCSTPGSSLGAGASAGTSASNQEALSRITGKKPARATRTATSAGSSASPPSSNQDVLNKIRAGGAPSAPRPAKPASRQTRSPQAVSTGPGLVERMVRWLFR